MKLLPSSMVDLTITDVRLLIAQVKGKRGKHNSKVEMLNGMLDALYAELQMRQGTNLQVNEEKNNGQQE